MAIVEEVVAVVNDTVIKHIGPRGNGGHDITIIKRSQKNTYSLYGRYFIPKDARHLNANNGYLIESLKTKVLEDAVETAIRRHVQIEQFIREDRPIRSERIKGVFNKFIDDYEKRMNAGMDNYSIHMFRGYKKTVQRYWLEYLENQGIEYIDDIKYEHFENYELWRKEYWLRHWDKKTRRHGNVKANPTQRTIQWDITMMKAFLKWAKNHRLMTIEVPDFKNERKKTNSRKAFSEEQWDKLVNYMTTDHYLTEGTKHGHDWLVARSRMLLRTFILIMGHSGLRPTEALMLRWKDLKSIKKSGGYRVGVLAVKSSHSKVNKFRECLLYPTGLRAYERLKDYREDNKHDNDYIFCDVKGKRLGDMREGFNNLLIKADIGYDSEDNKYTPYCCRHFFITQGLRRGIDAFTIAKNCGTSLDMIKNYYDGTIMDDHIETLTKGLPKYKWNLGSSPF